MKKIRFGVAALDVLLGIAVLFVFFQMEGKQPQQELTVPVSQMADLKFKKVALTFDDGPDPKYTKKLLDGLEKRNVKATFFVIGARAEKYPELIERMYEEGHLIGNHTYDHVQLTKISKEAGEEQILHTNEVIEEITGKRPEYMRPPYGECRKALEEKLPMFMALWDIDTRDWTGRRVNAICKEVFDKVEDGDVILMHDGYENSVEAALKIIDTLTKQGYRFVTLDQIYLCE